jgi:hypothetical protein
MKSLHLETLIFPRSVMSLRQISTRIELSFWQIVICLLSESRTVQKLIKWAYRDLIPTTAAHSERLDQKRVLLWAAAGIGLGSLCGFFISLF